MNYHAVFVGVFFLSKNLKLSSAASYRWRFMGRFVTVFVWLIGFAYMQ